MASKIKISINRAQSDSVKGLGLPLFLHAIKTSDLFDVGYHDEVCLPRHITLQSVLVCNGKKVLLDTYESAYTTCAKEVMKGDYALILKLQHKNMPLEDIVCFLSSITKEYSPDELHAFYNKTVPWTFFHSRMFERDWLKDAMYTPSSHNKVGFFCGRGWDRRQARIAELRQCGLEVLCSNHGGVPDMRLRNKDFIDRMLSSRLGIIMEGIDSPITDGKNRREMDYMLVRKPIVMDYKPCYYNPLVPGKHYIYWDRNIADISAEYTDADLAEIEHNAHEWYTKNASRHGMASSLHQILCEQCII